jgi:SAM-dependent methyltransferase
MAERMYTDLARFWPCLSPPSEYAAEAAFFLELLRSGARAPGTVLELGCGGGSLAWHLKRHFSLTLVDRSPEMLEVCRAANPECEVLEGDMRGVRLGRRFDAVLVHDAIMYATTEPDLAATIATAAAHCAPGGAVILAPDYTTETFEPERGHGGHAADGRSLRYVEWSWDPDPADTTFESAYTCYVRDRDGAERIVDDRHREGLFPEATWLRLLRESGLEASAVADPWRERIFRGVRRA